MPMTLDQFRNLGVTSQSTGYNITGQIPFNNAAGGMVSAGATTPEAKALGENYQSAYNAALEQNKAMYSNIMAGYQGLTQSVLGNIQGTETAQRQAIADQYAQQSGQTAQSLISRGLGNTTVANAMQRGVSLDRAKADINLSNQMAQLYAGYQSKLGGSQLDFMNSVMAKYPDAGAYYKLMEQAGMNSQRGRGTGVTAPFGGVSVKGGERNWLDKATGRAQLGGGQGGGAGTWWHGGAADKTNNAIWDTLAQQNKPLDYHYGGGMYGTGDIGGTAQNLPPQTGGGAYGMGGMFGGQQAQEDPYAWDPYGGENPNAAGSMYEWDQYGGQAPPEEDWGYGGDYGWD